MAVGPGSEDHKVTLRQGDEVILPSFGGSVIKNKDGEEELFLYRESEILAKVEA
jgi:chaperonin GroES